MGVNARDLLAFSKKIGAMPGEAARRGAISRGYYAAFHAARELLTDLGFTVFRGERAHAFLSLRLQNCGDSGIQKAGAELNDFRSQRNVADYDLHRAIAASAPQTWVRVAESLIRTFENAANEPTRTAITDAMKIYERDVLKDVTWHL